MCSVCTALNDVMFDKFEGFYADLHAQGILKTERPAASQVSNVLAVWFGVTKWK